MLPPGNLKDRGRDEVSTEIRACEGQRETRVLAGHRIGQIGISTIILHDTASSCPVQSKT